MKNLRLRRHLLPVLAGAVLAVGFAFAAAPSAQAFGIGIRVGGPVYVGGQPPPPPYASPVYASPGPGAVWIDGHYEWDGARWVWWPGYWAYPPRSGAVWVGGGFYWHDGHRYWGRGHWH